MDLMEKVKSSKRIYDGYKLNLRVDTVICPHDVETVKEVVERVPGISVLPIMPDGKVLLEREYRHPFNSVLIAAPAGKSDKGETLEQTAYRELEEETGYRAQKLQKIGEYYPAPAYSTEVIGLFIATDLIKGRIHEDKDEFIETFEVTLAEFKKMVKDGTIKDGKTVYIETWMEANGLIKN